jgi:microsomal dipeptidase-like Zn-dependent dipeptidase
MRRSAWPVGSLDVLVDLHAHYPMHLLPPEHARTHEHLTAWKKERVRAQIIRLLSRFFNYQGPGHEPEPGVTVKLMRSGDVGVVLSVLYSPFDEMDLERGYGAPPAGEYFPTLTDQLALVESDVAAHSDQAVVVRTPEQLNRAIAERRIAFIHAVEGGFQLGASEAEVRRNVAELAERGVAYVTLAHLFWRRVATSANAIPFLPDRLYRLLFRQPSGEGLSDLGKAAAKAMIEHGILIDISHMSEAATHDTLALLEELDPQKRVPVLATHVACRFGKLEYNLTSETIRRIADRGGLLGLLVCRHFVSDGFKHPRSVDGSVELLCKHIDRIRSLTGSFDHVAIGSDLDGYIKPALPGIEHLGRMRHLQNVLAARYGESDAAKVSSENALRVLRRAWRHPLATTQ